MPQPDLLAIVEEFIASLSDEEFAALVARTREPADAPSSKKARAVAALRQSRGVK